jgi:ankyrin repeat protein
MNNNLTVIFLELLGNGVYQDISNFLATNPAAVNTTFDELMGVTALHYAISQDDIDIARLLLERGADVNNNDNGFNEYPIHRAHSSEAIRLLKEYGADINVLDRGGRTILDNLLNNYAQLVDYGNVAQASRVLNAIKTIKSFKNLSKLKPFAIKAAKKSRLYRNFLLERSPFGLDISEKIARDVARGPHFGNKRSSVISDINYLRLI